MKGYRHVFEFFFFDTLGPFDLDLCAAPEPGPWPTAGAHFSENGLMLDWFGFVWCNPPYGDYTSKFLERMAIHRNGIALVFA